MYYSEQELTRAHSLLKRAIDRADDTDAIGILCKALDAVEKTEPKQELDEFLLGGPGHDGYVYNADVYCVDCGQGIIEELYSTDYGKLLSGDTDDSPQPIFFGESDCAEHCSDCGEYLYGESDEEETEEEDNA